MRKYILPIAVALAFLIAFTLAFSVSIVLGAYALDITITENASNTYPMLSCNTDLNIDYMASHDFCGSQALDTRVMQGLSAIPHMPVDDKLMFAVPVNADSSQTLQFTTGSSNLTDFYIIPGYSTNSSVGYITVADSASLELGDNFTIEQSGWVNTSYSANKTLLDKTEGIQSGIRVYISGTGNITAAIYSYSITDWETADSHDDPDGDWFDEANAYDDDTGTYAYGYSRYSAWEGYLYLYYDDPVLSDRVRGWVTGPCDKIEVSVREYGGGWEEIYEGAWDTADWVERTFSGIQETDAIRMRLWDSDGVNLQQKRVYEMQLGVLSYPSVTATGVSSGKHVVRTWADTSYLHISIDGVESDNMTLTANVTDNANNWIFFQNNVMPHCDNMTIEIDGVQQLWFDPDDIISGTNLPDRSGNSHNGTFVWGSNPTGVAITLGSLDSDYEPTTGRELVAPDVAPVVTPPSTLFPSDAAIIAAMENDPLYTWFKVWSDASGISILLMWWITYLGFGLIAFLAMYKNTHNLLISGAILIAVFGYAVNRGLFPFWLVLLMIMVLGAFVVMERRTQL